MCCLGWLGGPGWVSSWHELNPPEPYDSTSCHDVALRKPLRQVQTLLQPRRRNRAQPLRRATGMDRVVSGASLNSTDLNP